MPITIGTQLGSYEITALLGKGGMGEVYRARDTKLKREVAVKILPEEFSRDGDRASRFQREAEVLASLNHPNIAAIYDLQEANDTRFIVLELVEGETLADRIQRGPVPVEEALKIGQSICEALEAAHERGIIHRDLKPANVKITPDGKVKVLDFGLAKALENAPASPTVSNSPTMISATMGGTILGTAAYMSPEQARGRAADQRSDVFAFGCVLYEMLTGRPAFHGDEVSDVLASVLKTEPDWNLLPPDLNSRVHHVLRRALEKNPRRRWYAIGDVRVELETVLADGVEMVLRPEPATPKARLLWKFAIPLLITAIVVAIAAGTAAWKLKTSAPGAVTRFSFVLPQNQQFTATARQSLALSPDGSHLVYVANRQLFLRSMNELVARPLPGTTDPGTVYGPFFSPDGQWIGFNAVSDASLKKISITGGAPIQICKLSSNALGATWATGDQILFGDGQRGIMRVSAGGGEPEVLISIKPEEGTAYGPQMLEDGKSVLFTLAPPGSGGAERWERAQIVVESLRSRERKVIVRGGSDGRYLATGHIVYALGDKLYAQAFDASSLEPKGVPVSVIEGIQRALGPQPAAADIAFSANGTAVYIPGGPATAARRTLALVDLNGKAQTLPIMPGAYRSPRVSPDGNQLAFEVNQQIWLYDLSGNAPPRPLTFTGKNLVPVWDGPYLIFQSDQDTEVALYRQMADGSGAAERLTKPDQGTTYVPFSVDPSGRVLSLVRYKGVNAGISFLALTGDQNVPKTLTEVPSSHAAFSPDGRWMAFQSRIGERPQIFVRPYPSLDAKHFVADPGNSPVWSRDGKQLFYLRPPDKFVAVDIQTQPVFSVGKSSELPIAGTIHDSNSPRNFDITPDGKFVVVMAASPAEFSQQTTSQINVVLNWFEELKQRLRAR